MRTLRHDRRGTMVLVLAAATVMILGLLGLAGSAGVNSFTSTSEMTSGDIVAERLVRLALDEAAEYLEEKAGDDTSPWYEVLRQSRIDGAPLSGLEGNVPLPRTRQIATEEGLEWEEIAVFARLVQQSPFGVRFDDKLWGGDQTYGTIALRGRVELEAPRSRIFSAGRKAEATRLIGFRATLSKPPAPFDQSPLWVADPQFLRTAANDAMQQLLAGCAIPPGTPLPDISQYFNGLLYSRMDHDVVRAEELSVSIAGAGCSGAIARLNRFISELDASYRILKNAQDADTMRHMERLYWPQLADGAFASPDLGRADRYFATEEELREHLRVSPGRPVQLDGIYYVAGPVTVDWRYTGNGSIVTPRSIRVLRAAKTEPDDTLMLVSTGEDISLAQAVETVEAALIATRGTVTGLSGKHVRGLLVAEYLSAGFEHGSGTLLELDPALGAHQPGISTADPTSLQIHFDPVPLAQS